MIERIGGFNALCSSCGKDILADYTHPELCTPRSGMLCSPPFSAAAYLKDTGPTDGLCKFACQGAFAATSGTRDTNGKRYCMWVHTAAFPPCLPFRCPHLLCWHGRRAERGSLFNLCRLWSTADPRRGFWCGTGLELKVAIARLAHVENVLELRNANLHPYTYRSLLHTNI